jgi:hypothetical protein
MSPSVSAKIRGGCAAAVVLLAVVFFSEPSFAYTIRLATPEDNKACLSCHSSTSFLDRLPPEKAAELKVGESALVNSAHSTLTCIECHRGLEEIPHKPPYRGVNCGHCHSLEVSSKRGSIYDALSYSESIHARARAHGNKKAAVCTSCHGTHDILPVRNPASRVSRGNIPRTCGKCHENVFDIYARSIHGK